MLGTKEKGLHTVRLKTKTSILFLRQHFNLQGIPEANGKEKTFETLYSVESEDNLTDFVVKTGWKQIEKEEREKKPAF